MVRCSVIGCKSDSGTKMPGLSFHSFHEHHNLRRNWIVATGRTDWTPKPSSKICSIHFEDKMLIKKKKLTLLLPNAVPVLETKACIPSSSSISLHEETGALMKIEDNLNININPAIDLLPSTSGQKSVAMAHSPISKQPSIDKTPEYTPRTLRKKWKQSEKLSSERLKKLKCLREKSRRLTKKVAKLENVIAELKTKCLISEEDGDLLESIDQANRDFLKKMLNPTSSGRKYSPSLRKFALCLQFISPRAYKYVRQQFNTCLPHPSTLTSWYKSVDANPGFTTESLECIKLVAKNKKTELFCAVSMDEMAIRRHVQWDGRKCVGLVNYGAALDGHNVAEAREALVFMVTFINSRWKMPISYFFIDGCTGEQKATLIKQCIGLLVDCGVKIVSLTFDGCPANFSMAKSLGCKIDDLENITSYFVSDNQHVVMFPDPAHMLKLVRNTLGQKNELSTLHGGTIKWHFIELLHNLQEKEGLHLANRLKNQHINFSKQIMKVKLAAQTFSNSVADAIEFCDKQLNLPEFSGSDDTVDFIRKFNNLFDIFNSRNLNMYGFKKPINSKNGDIIIDFIDVMDKYIRGLQLEGKLILQTNRKVGFIGFLICIQSLKKMYADIIVTGKLKFIPVYKLSQDHLECFFSSIRSKGGYNNNPTAFQFQSAYKRLVIHGEIKGIESGNCIPLEDVKILTHTEVRYENKINMYCTQEVEDSIEDYPPNLNLLVDDDHDYIFNLSKLTTYTEEIISYIGGFVVRKLRKTIKCGDCLLGLISDKYLGLIFKKDKGGLIYPSHDVIKVCKLAERIFKIHSHGGISFFAEKNILPKLILMTFKRCQDVFMSDHFESQPFIGNHKVLLIKAISMHYFELRIHHATKGFEPKQKIRNLHTKLVLFQGQ